MIPVPSVTQPHGRWTNDTDQFLTPGQQRLKDGYLKLKAEAERRGFAPASVISLHPFSWPVTGPVHQTDIKIPAIPLNEEHWLAAPKLALKNGLEVPFAQYVFAQWKPLQQKYLVGQMDHEEVNDSGHIWPIDQANDAVNQNSLSADRGGVFCYEGAHAPGRKKETAEVELELLDRAHLVQMAYYTSQYEKYSDAYGSRQSTNAWKDLAGKGKYHRWIAMYLYRVGSLRALPPWYEEISQTGALKQGKCDECQQTVETGAVTCRHCNRVLMPFVWFDKLHGDAESPGARMAAKRLSDSELDLLMKDGKLEFDKLEEWGIITGKTKKKTKAEDKTKEEKTD